MINILNNLVVRVIILMMMKILSTTLDITNLKKDLKHVYDV